MRFLEALLGNANRKLYPFERMILQEVVSRIDAAHGRRMRQQIEVVNYVQRHRNGKEVNLYHMQHGKAVFHDDWRFSGSPDEELLATAALTTPPTGTRLKADVWMTGGRIFSIEFDKNPEKFFSEARLQDARPEVAEIIIRSERFAKS